jgi:hypothetical protein
MVSECTVSVLDMTGRIVQKTTWTDTQQVRLDVSTLGEGIYWLEVWSEEYRYSGKFVRR